MADRGPSSTPWLSRVSKWAAYLAAVLLLSALTLKLLYSTALGFAVADAIPDAVWRMLEATYGPADGESAQNVEAIGLAGVSVLVALALVSVATLLLRRRRA